MNFRIQRFGSDGEHLWSRGREGEGPGEFENVQIVHGCVSADRIVVYDIWTQRVSVFNDEGDLVDDYRFLYNGLPIRRFGCAPNGRLGFTGDSDHTVEGLPSEELYRELMTLGWVELGDTVATTVRQRIPGSEARYLGPGNVLRVGLVTPLRWLGAIPILVSKLRGRLPFPSSTDEGWLAALTGIPETLLLGALRIASVRS